MNLQQSADNYGTVTEDSQDSEINSFRGSHPLGEISTHRSNSSFGSAGAKLKRSSILLSTQQRIKSDLNRIGRVEELSDEEEESANSSFQQASSVYEIHRILSCDKYTIGNSVQEYIESFGMQYKNVEESVGLLPQPIESI